MSATTSEARLLDRLNTSLGPIRDLLADESVEDICANIGSLWVERRGKDPIPFDENWTAAKAIDIITNVAPLSDRFVSRKRPVLEAILPASGARFHGTLPPLSEAPVFSIRTRPGSVIPICDYVANGTVCLSHADELLDAIYRGKNIVVAGGTGSGKTTLLNALLKELADVRPQDRVLTIEDTLEIQCSSPNHVAFHATEGITMRECLRNALRMVPRRIVVGEVRGREALDLIMAWHTGHRGGMGTIHANSARGALGRFEQLIRLFLRDSGSALKQEIASAIDYVAFIQKDPDSPSGRRLTELIEVGWEDGHYRIEEIPACER